MTGRSIVAAVLVAGACLAGCTSGGTTQVGAGSAGGDATASARTDTLWANRTDYTGDNSKVIGLVREAGFGPTGSYTISLGTSSRPYALTVTLDEPEKPADATDFTTPATVLLGTVGNLDEVYVVDGADEWSLTAAQATTALGYDVKRLGTDRDTLRAYVAAAED